METELWLYGENWKGKTYPVFFSKSIDSRSKYNESHETLCLSEIPGPEQIDQKKKKTLLFSQINNV